MIEPAQGELFNFPDVAETRRRLRRAEILRDYDAYFDAVQRAEEQRMRRTDEHS